MNPRSSACPSARARILLVEPPSVFREMQSLLLQSVGYAATNFDNIAVALQGLRAAPCDILVLNSEASDSENADAVVQIRREFPGVAIIYVAGVLTVEITRDLSRLGITVVLQRPIDPQLLISKLDEATGTNLRPAVSFAAAPFETAADAAPATCLPPVAAASNPPLVVPSAPAAARFSLANFFAGPSPIRMDSVPPFNSNRSESGSSDFESAHPFSR